LFKSLIPGDLSDGFEPDVEYLRLNPVLQSREYSKGEEVERQVLAPTKDYSLPHSSLGSLPKKSSSWFFSPVKKTINNA